MTATKMGFFTKFLAVPKAEAVIHIVAAQTWEVRWTAKTGKYGHDRDELQAFFTPEEANSFADALRNAFALTRSYGAETITVEKSK